jgi:hypothetical protein
VYLTLKALANYSPALALQPWVNVFSNRLFATLKGLRHVWRFTLDATPSQGCKKLSTFLPGVSKQTLG